MYHGVDSAQYRPEPQRRESEDGPPEATAVPVVGTLSRLDEPKKGIAVLLAAVAMLERRGRPVSLRIAGDGDSRQALQRKAAELSLSDCRFLGYVGDPADFYRLLDVFVLPSFSEGFPLSNLEAMASGVALVTTDAGGAAEAVEPLISGLVVPIGDAEALAEALERLIADPGLRRRMADAGRTRVQERFTIEASCNRILGVYSEVSNAWRSNAS